MQNPRGNDRLIFICLLYCGVVRSPPDMYFSSTAEKGAGTRIPSSICHIHLETATVPLSTGSLMRIINVFST